MSKVLVVDDEPRYREHITRVLERDAHDVRSAANGRDAINLGSRFRPDFLIADWMLKGHIHGLMVSEALRAIVPDMRTILITGYPSYDLRNEAQRFWVTKFLEKPFELSEIRDALSEPSSAPAAPHRPSGIATLEIDRQGSILFANPRARELFDLDKPTANPHAPPRLEPSIMDRLPEAARSWIALTLPNHPERTWSLRAKIRGTDAAWLAFVVPADRPHLKNHPAIRTLLESDGDRECSWPFAGRTLLIDRDDNVRKVIAAQIERAGGASHGADNLEQARRILERDPDIDFLIVDFHLPGEDLSAFVRLARFRHPDAEFLGTSGDERSAEFRQVGISQFLQKPWTVVDLLNMLSSCVGYRDCAGSDDSRASRAQENRPNPG